MLRTHHLYRPTQDPAGHQRALLQQLADAALQLAQARQQAACGKGAGVGVLPAALGVLQGILAVEHRVIQQQLPALWPLLLWSPAAASGSGGSGGVAAAVACSLVAAFAELRQLEVLLASLAEALQQPPVGSEASAAAEAVLHSRSVQAALATAVRQLPSGQVPMLLRLAAGAAPQLGNGSGGSLLAADLYCACLASLQVDLTTAMSAAAAAAALVSALSPLLLPLLSATAGGGKADKKQAALLAALLRLYSRALALHARCAALHPEVSKGPSSACTVYASTVLCPTPAKPWPLPALILIILAGHSASRTARQAAGRRSWRPLCAPGAVARQRRTYAGRGDAGCSQRQQPGAAAGAAAGRRAAAGGAAPAAALPLPHLPRHPAA